MWGRESHREQGLLPVHLVQRLEPGIRRAGCEVDTNCAARRELSELSPCSGAESQPLSGAGRRPRHGLSQSRAGRRGWQPAGPVRHVGAPSPWCGSLELGLRQQQQQSKGLRPDPSSSPIPPPPSPSWAGEAAPAVPNELGWEEPGGTWRSGHTCPTWLSSAFQALEAEGLRMCVDKALAVAFLRAGPLL